MNYDISKTELDAYLVKIQEFRISHGLNFCGTTDSDEIRKISENDLTELMRLQDLMSPIHFSSHRKFFGPLIVALKTYLIKILDPLFRRRFGRQFEINQFNWNLATIVKDQQDHIGRLELRINKLESFLNAKR